MHFFVFQFNKKSWLFALSFALLMLCHAFALPVVYASSPKSAYTIVIDPGHGGRDGGTKGVVTKNLESELNLIYANDLKKLLEGAGINVVMTRSTLDVVYTNFASSRKTDDMNRRRQIIEKAKPNVVVSIHMNSYPSGQPCGAQTFYQRGRTEDFGLAEIIQNQLIKNVKKARRAPATGDYFILQCTAFPSVLVECGYLSNPEEDVLLGTKEHREKIVYSIFEGLIMYLGAAGN